MQAERITNHSSLHSVWAFLVKASGLLSIGKVDYFQRGQRGAVSFGISSQAFAHQSGMIRFMRSFSSRPWRALGWGFLRENLGILREKSFWAPAIDL